MEQRSGVKHIVLVHGRPAVPTGTRSTVPGYLMAKIRTCLFGITCRPIIVVPDIRSGVER
jgi:hypothetical protein